MRLVILKTIPTVTHKNEVNIKCATKGNKNKHKQSVLKTVEPETSLKTNVSQLGSEHIFLLGNVARTWAPSKLLIVCYLKITHCIKQDKHVKILHQL